jgi:hypothetical protein
MKKTLYLVLILIIFGLSYLKWQAWKNPEPSIPVATPTPAPTSSAVMDSLRLTTEYFTLDYPSVASASPVSESPDSLTWTVRHVGETQVKSGRTQSELSDGYAITITRFGEVLGDDPALTQAESDRAGTMTSCGESSVSSIRDEKIAGRNAHAFTGGCIAEATSFYFMDGESLYRLSTMAVGTPEDVFNYQQAVDKSLSTLKLLE